MRRAWRGVVITAFLGACTKGDPNAASAPVALTGSPISASHGRSPPVEPGTASAASFQWHGSYDSVAGTLRIPPQIKTVRWTGVDLDAGLGEGTMSLAVDPNTGRVKGSIEGPLGPATIEGYAADGMVAAAVQRKDPTDRGFAGTLVGTMTDAGAGGTMNVSLAEASAIRTATFKLSSVQVPGP